MLKSMTGYGKANGILAGRTISVEIKTLNHRYTEFFCRLPVEFSAQEITIRKMVTGRVTRGKIELSVKVENKVGENSLKLNEDLIKNYFSMLLKIQDTLGLKDNVKLADILSLKGVFSQEEETASEEISEMILPIIASAVDSLEEMKLLEGGNLQSDIARRLVAMQTVLQEIEMRVPLCVAEYQKRLARRVRELTDGVEISEERLAQEVAIMAEKSDISEEITRLHSHFSQLSLIMADTESKDQGRKMDFLIQEMAREVNTIGAKSGDMEIAKGVITLKSELSKIREQVQNIE